MLTDSSSRASSYSAPFSHRYQPHDHMSSSPLRPAYFGASSFPSTAMTMAPSSAVTYGPVIYNGIGSSSGSISGVKRSRWDAGLSQSEPLAPPLPPLPPPAPPQVMLPLLPPHHTRTPLLFNMSAPTTAVGSISTRGTSSAFGSSRGMGRAVSGLLASSSSFPAPTPTATPSAPAALPEVSVPRRARDPRRPWL